MALAHAVSTLDQDPDPKLEQACISISHQFLCHGGDPNLRKTVAPTTNGIPPEGQYQKQWEAKVTIYPFNLIFLFKDISLVQKAAIQSLSLLLLSNPDKNWSAIFPVISSVVSNPNFSTSVRSDAVKTYGKLGFFLSNSNPFFATVKEILFKMVSVYDIQDPQMACACSTALAIFVTAHPELHHEAKLSLQRKMKNTNTFKLSEVPEEHLHVYLLPWCKLITRQYSPLFTKNSVVLLNVEPNKNKKEPKDEYPPISQEFLIRIRDIAASPYNLLQLCTDFSRTVLEVLVTVLKKEEILTNEAIRSHLSLAIKVSQSHSR